MTRFSRLVKREVGEGETAVDGGREREEEEEGAGRQVRRETSQARADLFHLNLSDNRDNPLASTQNIHKYKINTAK